MKKIYLCAVIIALGLFIITCKKDKKTAPTPVKTGFTVMTNGADPLIVSYAKSAQESVDFYGTRDAKGVPLKINMVILKKNADTTIYKLDDTGRPVDVIAPNGTKFEFTWSTPQKAALTIISKDGLNQLNTNIDLSKKTTTALKGIKTNNPRPGNNASIQFTPYPNLQANAVNATGNTSNVTVNVTACGLPTDGEVAVHLKSKSGEQLGYFPAYPVGKGSYVAQVPTDKAPKINPGEICATIAGVLDIACMANESGLTTLLCPAITIAVASTQVGALFAAEIYASCTAVTAGLELYCGTLNGSGAPGAPTLAEMICESDVLDRAITEDIYIYATVTGLPYNSYSQFKLVSAGSALPNLSVALSSTTTIRKLTLNPSSPAAYQGYVATSDIFCLQTGSVITMEVTGTDGYHNSQTNTVTSTQQSGLFSLSVPGGASQVEDKITLTIKLPNGTTLTRDAQLIFN
jgi:hypothetical protein